MSDALPQLEQLYRDLAPALLAYFRRQPRLHATADDLVQDTFIRAWRGFPRLQAAVSPRAYLFGIARHVGLDALRAQRPTEELPADWPDDTTGPADDRLPAMRAAIATLPEPQREALQLKLQHDLSYEEIAEVLAIPIGTVRSRLHHAVARLRESLNPPPATPAP